MKKHILIVDDEQPFLSAMLRDLREFSDKFNVYTCAKSQKTLDSINDLDIDLLITDILMPEKEGLEIITEVKEKFPSVKIIAMTGGHVTYLESAQMFGADDVLCKPFSKDELILAVNSLLVE